MNRLIAEMNPSNKLFFSVIVLNDIDGHTLQALEPDECGYYITPLAVLGEVTLNKTLYTTKSFVDCIANENTAFNIKLRTGGLYGEWGHPPHDASIARISTIDRERESHHFYKVWTESSGAMSSKPVVYGSVRPTGPRGPYLEASFRNPRENTAFSLRVLHHEELDRTTGIRHRTIVDFITFDAVQMPGFVWASKRYTPKKAGVECLYEREITVDMLFDSDGKRVGLESYSDHDLADLFGIRDFSFGGQTLGSYFKNSTTYLDTNGMKRSVVHSILTK